MYLHMYFYLTGAGLCPGPVESILPEGRDGAIRTHNILGLDDSKTFFPYYEHERERLVILNTITICLLGQKVLMAALFWLEQFIIIF